MNARPVASGDPLTDYKIKDPDSFVAATSEPRQVAGLYFFLQLDCLIDYAYRVAGDFFRRPQLYLDVSASQADSRSGGGSRTTIAGDLARLRARYGSNEQIPSQEQRDAIFLPIFGESGTYPANVQAAFPRLRDGLLDAAATFAERVFDTGEDMLRAAVRTAHRPFQLYLTGLQGDSLEWSRSEVLAKITEDLAYKILRNDGVAAVFGLSAEPTPSWPYTEDSNADKLVEEISKQLLMPGGVYPPITREGFSNRQRTALRGAEALATIVDFHEGGPKADLDLLITKCYTWRSALRSLS